MTQNKEEWRKKLNELFERKESNPVERRPAIEIVEPNGAKS